MSLSLPICQDAEVGLYLRRTEKPDLPFVLRLERSPEHLGLVGQWGNPEHEDALFDGNALHLIVEDLGGEPLGYLIVIGMQRNDSVELKRIVMDRKNQGYGTVVLDILKRYLLHDLGYQRIWLQVRNTNLKAQRIYRRAGFRDEPKMEEGRVHSERTDGMLLMSIKKDEI